MTILQAIILGVVQGITEFLPISSSGHLVIFQHLLGLEESQITFDVFVHVASLLAILIFFFPKLIRISKNQIIAIIIGTIPAVIFGLVFKDTIEGLFSSVKFVSITLMITAGINFTSDYLLKKADSQEKTISFDKKGIKHSFKPALIIGSFQALAIIPGISRSGSTLMGGLSQKMDRQSAFDYAFFLAIPAILGAGILQVLDMYLEGFSSYAINWTVFLAGGIAAFISGFISLSFFNYILKSARLKWFAWYCLLLGISTFFLL